MDAANRQKLPVLFVNTPTTSPIGADTWIHAEIIRALDRSRFEVHVACMTGSPDAPTPLFETVAAIPDIELIAVNFGREHAPQPNLPKRVLQGLKDIPVLLSFFKLAVYVRRRRIPIIHTTSRPRDALACVILAKLTRTKSIIHMQLGFGMWMSRSLRWSLRNADGLVAITEFVRTTLVDSGHRPERIHLAYNVVVFRDWTPGEDKSEVRRELGLRTEGPMVVTVSRLFKEKGTAELLRAIALVRNEIPGVQLVVVGRDVTPDHVFTAELQQIIEQEQLHDNVTFVGQRSDIPRYMAAADLFAMPSHLEPFGIVFAEAMAMELPVVALNDGGTPEVVEHGQTGLLSDYGDIESLATNLLTLLRDPERRQQMGAAGRERVTSRFTAEHLASEMAEIYERIAR